MKYILIILILLSLAACEGDNMAKNPVPDPVPHTNSVIISGKEIVLSPYLWRDFMPMVTEESDKLRASIKLLTADSSAIPEIIDFDRIWVYHNSEVWETEFPPTGEIRNINSLSKTVGGGPKWDPQTYVDLVLRIKVDTGYIFLKKSDIYIDQTF